MPELRWTLLIVGGLFVLGLALWEIRRQRQAPRQNRLDSTSPSMDAGNSSSSSTQSSVGFGDPNRVRNEPVITLPELQPIDPRGEPRLSARREATHDPPVVEVDDAAFARLSVQGETGTTDRDDAADAEDTIAMSIDDDDGDIDAELRDAVARRAGLEPDDIHAGDAAESFSAERDDAYSSNMADGGRAGLAARGDAGRDSELGRSGRAAEAPPFAAVASGEEPLAAEVTRGAGTAPPSESVGFATDTDSDDQHNAAAQPLEGQSQPARDQPPAGATAGAPIVDWPTESSRKIVALRLVSQPAARFQGRVVRQALAAEGFVLGKFDIFHKAGPDDRAVLSAASLTKPGTFAMNTIDGQRFGGISLFAVLPGPLPPQETFDELLHTARALNDRLQGALQDERGEPLTPMRSASIRQSLSEGNGSAGSGTHTEPQSETRQ
jgi:FtsZ-interacting cell division protein ZipA